MNKTELEKKIAEMQEQFDKMQKQLDELKQVKVEEPKMWKPKNGEYYCVGVNGEIVGSFWHDDKVDNWRYLNGNIFENKEEAEEYRKKINIQAQFKNFVEERSDELDWEDDDQDKYYLLYNHDNKKIVLECAFVKKYQGAIYASSEQILKDAIAEIGKENIKKYVLEVEE